MNYSNDSQGVYTRMTFSYNPGGKLSNVTIANQSKGMEGPASLTLGYDGAGLINHLEGQMGFSKGTLQFNLNLAFAKNRKTSSIVTVPPPTATKMGREELETLPAGEPGRARSWTSRPPASTCAASPSATSRITTSRPARDPPPQRFWSRPGRSLVILFPQSGRGAAW